MLSNLKRFHRPKTIPQALALLEKNSGSILIIAGGTKLVLTPNDVVEELVDVTALDLHNIISEEGNLRIGATTTLQRIAEDPVIKDSVGDFLSMATLLTRPSRMVRNAATLGGELAVTGPLSPLYCALLVLQAQVRIIGGEEFALAMNIFQNRKKLAGGVIVETLIPALAPQTYAAIIPIPPQEGHQPAMCACVRITLKEQICTEAKIAITGMLPVPQRLHEVEKVIEGRALGSQTLLRARNTTCETCIPISDAFASSEYRQEMSGLLVQRGLEKCLRMRESWDEN